MHIVWIRLCTWTHPVSTEDRSNLSFLSFLRDVQAKSWSSLLSILCRILHWHSRSLYCDNDHTISASYVDSFSNPYQGNLKSTLLNCHQIHPIYLFPVKEILFLFSHFPQSKYSQRSLKQHRIYGYTYITGTWEWFGEFYICEIIEFTHQWVLSQRMATQTCLSVILKWWDSAALIIFPSELTASPNNYMKCDLSLRLGVNFDRSQF